MKDDIKIYSEEEAIQLTVDLGGYDGSEFKTKDFIERGYLRGNGNSQKKLIRKLETIYETVEFSGKGKKRLYTLQGERSDILKRKFNHKGRRLSKEDEVIKEYIFNRLVNHDKINGIYSHSNSISKWCKYFGFPEYDMTEVKELTKIIKNEYYGKGLLYNPREVADNFVQKIHGRNKDVVKNSFNWLEKEGRIKQTERYYSIGSDDSINEIDEGSYDLIVKELNVITEKFDISYSFYLFLTNSFNKNFFATDTLRKVELSLEQKYDVKHVFKKINVSLLSQEYQEVAYDECMKNYFKRFWILAKNRYSTKEYDKTTNFVKYFTLENFYLLMSHTLLSKYFDETEDYSPSITKIENYKKAIYRERGESYLGDGSDLIRDIEEQF